MSIKTRLGALICALAVFVGGSGYAATTTITVQDSDGVFAQQELYGLYQRSNGTLYGTARLNDSGQVTLNVPTSPALDGQLLGAWNGFSQPHRLQIQPGNSMFHPMPLNRNVRVKQLGNLAANRPVECYVSDSGGQWYKSMELDTAANGRVKFTPPMFTQKIFFHDVISGSTTMTWNLDTQRLPDPVELVATAVGTPELDGYMEYMGFPVWSWEEYTATTFSRYDALLCDTSGRLINRTSVDKETIHIETSGLVPADGFLIGVAVVDSNGYDLARSYLYGPFYLEDTAKTKSAVTKTPVVSQTKLQADLPVDISNIPVLVE